MLLQNVALVSEMSEISSSELCRVSAALQKQATRDFSPIWEVVATVDPFTNLDDVPLGYWPVIIMKDIEESGALGVHLDQDGQPFAVVEFDPDWSLTASHECLEMLADPFGNRLVGSKSVKDPRKRVEYLVEVCDPPEDVQFAYTVNEITVSDFYTPNFFAPVKTNVRYSFTGAITEPREVLRGGYLSWHDPVTDEWWQETFFDSSPQFVNLGRISRANGSIREQIDRRAREQMEHQQYSLTQKHKVAAAAPGLRAVGQKEPELRPFKSRAEAWREQIAELRRVA